MRKRRNILVSSIWVFKIVILFGTLPTHTWSLYHRYRYPEVRVSTLSVPITNAMNSWILALRNHRIVIEACTKPDNTYLWIQETKKTPTRGQDKHDWSRGWNMCSQQYIRSFHACWWRFSDASFLTLDLSTLCPKGSRVCTEFWTREHAIKRAECSVCIFSRCLVLS